MAQGGSGRQAIAGEIKGLRRDVPLAWLVLGLHRVALCRYLPGTLLLTPACCPLKFAAGGGRHVVSPCSPSPPGAAGLAA